MIARLLILAAFISLSTAYAVQTPPWQNPDEPAHANYVAQLATTGTLPELRQGDWDSALLERVKNGQPVTDDEMRSIRYEGWQPPLYYLLAAPIFLMGSSDSALMRLRLLGVALGTLALIPAYFAARELFAPSLAIVVPAVIAGIPMFSAVSASVSADPLANLFGATLVLLLLRSLSRPVDLRWAALLGVVVGLSVLTKLALAIYAPLALAIVLLRACDRLRASLVLVGTSAAITVPWLVHQVTTYGPADPLALARHASVVADQPRFAAVTPEYLAAFLTVSFHSFWAQFGWMSIPASDRLYWLWGVLALVALAGLVRGRRVFREARWQLILVTLGLAIVAYVAYNLAFTQFQGRYLFTAIVAIVALLVAGWAVWLPRQWVWLVPVVLIALNVYTLTRVLGPGFAPPI